MVTPDVLFSPKETALSIRIPYFCTKTNPFPSPCHTVRPTKASLIEINECSVRLSSICFGKVSKRSSIGSEPAMVFVQRAVLLAIGRQLDG